MHTVGPMQTVGIDLAAQPADTGVCIVDWDAMRIVSVRANSTTGADHELVDVMCDPAVVKVGVDAPLGWPDAFVAAVQSHHLGGPWPDIAGAVDDPGSHRRALRLRLTDVAVAAATGRHPMSVSADRIAVAAMRAAVLQHLVAGHGDAGVVVDRSGATGRLAEVYPAAALAVWGLEPTRYKGKGDDARRRRAVLIEAVAQRCGLAVDTGAGDAMVASDHLFDAFVCAVVARAVVDGATTGPAIDHMPVARREGWIHVPSPTWGDAESTSGNRQ